MSQEETRRGDGSLFNEDSMDGFLHRAFLRATGRSGEEVRQRPVIGICSSASELNPCNAGLSVVAESVKRGVLAAGGLPVVFPTISISEAFVRPTSMFLRNLMAMDVEQMITSSPVDAVVLLGGCDKTIPAQVMGALSAGKPALLIAAGPRPVGRFNGEVLTVDDFWPLAARRRRGELSDQDWNRLEGCLMSGVGTCNVMGTATTMATVAEVLGLALPGSTLLPATGSARQDAAVRTGARAVALAKEGRPPSEVVTAEAIEDAFRVVCAIGGSTNAMVHIAAMAGRIGAPLDFATWSRTTPLLGDVRPSGPYLLEDLAEAGGIPAVVKELAPVLHLDRPSASGATWADEVAAVEPKTGGALRPFDRPVAAGGALAVLTGSLAPDGAVIKRSAMDHKLLRHTGRALVFDGVTDLNARIDDPGLPVDADSVLVLRGVGPVGGPGMPEVGHVPIPAKLAREGVEDMVRISDGRMSGTADGAVVLHVAPEAAVGGPLALVRDGDLVELDVDAGRLELLVPAEELERRKAEFTPPEGPSRGYELLYHRHVLQSPDGCDFDFLQKAPKIS
ncbi:dihydroxy-acid dehydratase [Amycolatopsis sp. YIM 10]|uniref:dihydroxy-acid dehydratase n=1 Tax=Amycolatopsis sp. YIM 10 TaxID=2653857 RepID=UPI00128FD173|nr:dihydroxy-acid dehydratase [Amycolatopsis sp. YIM 10]